MLSKSNEENTRETWGTLWMETRKYGSYARPRTFICSSRSYDCTCRNCQTLKSISAAYIFTSFPNLKVGNFGEVVYGQEAHIMVLLDTLVKIIKKYINDQKSQKSH